MRRVPAKYTSAITVRLTKEGGIAHARPRQHQADDHDRQQQPQLRLARQQGVEKAAQAVAKAGARRGAQVRQEQADAEGEAELKVTRQVVAVDERSPVATPRLELLGREQQVLSAREHHEGAVRRLERYRSAPGRP